MTDKLWVELWDEDGPMTSKEEVRLHTEIKDLNAYVYPKSITYMQVEREGTATTVRMYKNDDDTPCFWWRIDLDVYAGTAALWDKRPLFILPVVEKVST